MALSDQEIIRKAVELADGFVWQDPMTVYIQSLSMAFYCSEPFMLDALAAQLVRQVDARGVASVYIVPDMTEVQWEYADSDDLQSVTERGPDRTLNTLRAIVESGVLE